MNRRFVGLPLWWLLFSFAVNMVAAFTLNLLGWVIIVVSLIVGGYIGGNVEAYQEWQARKK